MCHNKKATSVDTYFIFKSALRRNNSTKLNGLLRSNRWCLETISTYEVLSEVGLILVLFHRISEVEVSMQRRLVQFGESSTNLRENFMYIYPVFLSSFT